MELCVHITFSEEEAGRPALFLSRSLDFLLDPHLEILGECSAGGLE